MTCRLSCRLASALWDRQGFVASVLRYRLINWYVTGVLGKAVVPAVFLGLVPSSSPGIDLMPHT